MRLMISAATGAFLAVATTAHSTEYCVSTAEQLTSALAAIEASPDEQHVVKIHTGTYLAPAGGWHVNVRPNGNIRVAGGYDGDNGSCPSQVLPDPGLTRLDGHQAERPLTILTELRPDQDFGIGGQITVSGLTFENGVGASAGGLKISDSGPIFNGSILVERSIFRNNVGTMYAEDDSAGGLVAATDGPDFSGNAFLIVRDNLFSGNRAPDGAAATLFSNNTIDVADNTFTGNQSSGVRQGLPILIPHNAVTTFTLSGVVYTNNIFWNNNPDNIDGTFDLRADNPIRASLAADLFNNDLQAVSGQPATSSGNVAVDPVFVDAAQEDFHLAGNSPMINAGKEQPEGGFAIIGLNGFATAVDVEGSFRVQGANIDIGAYESDSLFQAGFDAP